MSIKKLLFTFLLGSALLFSRAAVGLNINTDDFEAEASYDINAFSEYTNGTMFVLSGNFLSTEADNLFGIGLSAHNSFLGMEGLSIGLGAKLVYLDDFMAIPLMAKASYAVMFTDSMPAASFSAALLYAPTVLSFDDAQNYFEFRAEVSMEVISSVSIYGGYRDIETEYIYEDFDTLNSSFYLGLKMGF